MRKTKLATYAVALTLAAAAMTGISTETAHAEEAAQVVATDTDAAVEETTEAVTEEAATEEATTEAEVVADEVTVADEGGDTYYNINENGGEWDGTHYTLNGQVITNVFFCDGTYTYYLQADGTPMQDRLTYHPDGEHVIYFDANGHEVFSDYANITKTITGESVNDLCFFNTYGYMYVNKLTYDKAGENLYYVNEYGVIERGNKWFKFAYEIEDITGEQTVMAEGYGFATEDGALLANQFTYNWNGSLVYMQGNGLMATGLLNIGGTYYLFDMNDGHIVETYTSMPGEYSLIEYESNGGYSVYKYNGETLIGSDTYSAAGQQTYHFELNRTGNVEKSYSWGLDGFYGKEIETYNWTNVYDEYNNIVSYESTGKFVTLIDETGQLEWHEYTNHTDRTYYDAASGKCSYEKGMTYSADGKLTDTTERYFNNDADNCLSGEKICYYEQGILVQVTETVMYEHTTWNKYTEKTTLYDGNGNVSDISVFYYDTEGTELYYEGYDEDGHKIYYGRRDANGEMLYFEAYNLDGSVQYSVTYNPDGTVTWS